MTEPAKTSGVSFGREPFNGYSHLAAAVVAFVAGVILIGNSGGAPMVTSAKTFYALTLFLAFFSSALFHLVIGPPSLIERLRNFDHFCIRALIVGTYAPFAIVMLPPGWSIGILGTFAFLVFMESALASRANGKTTRIRKSCSYIALASLSLIAVPFLWDRFKEPILWTCLGSCFYILGAWCYLKKFPPKSALIDFHQTWHICVIIGAFIHYAVIFRLH
ncbi:MAG: hemolysin III family protein [Verrucomicrobiota bacterium]